MSSLLPEQECPTMKQDTIRGFFKKMATKLETQLQDEPLEPCATTATEKIGAMENTSGNSTETLVLVSDKNQETVGKVTSNKAPSQSSFFFGKIQQRISTNSKLMQNSFKLDTTVVTHADNHDTASNNSQSVNLAFKTDPALTCPVCKKQDSFKNLQALNEHIDQCLLTFHLKDDTANENTFDSALCKNDVVAGITMDSVEMKEHATENHVIFDASSNAISSDASNNNSADESSRLRIEQDAKQSKNDLNSVVRENSVIPGASCHRDDGHPADGCMVCPICNLEQRSCDLDMFNNHVDVCLSKGAIREILSEENSRKR